ncbi:MAG: hypothetical protein HQ509_09260 [Candidatus Marinimicrobia bacterium]|nr:hypothetical protein [Candidatus Neomarinimicrobiota bacterium]
MKPKIILLLILLSSTTIVANDQQSILSGFIKFDAFYDTHPMVAAREGHYALYPDDGPDKAQLNFVTFQSRFRITSPTYDIPFGKVTGLIEADFFGTADGNENQLRLRHSFIKMYNDKATILFGQYWTPLFNIHVFPGTISFNTGVPFQPFARMPQIQAIYKISKTVSLLAALTMQRDAYQEIGGNEKQIDAGIPGIHLHGRFTSKTLFAGSGFYYKTISPDSDIILNSIVTTAYTKMTLGAMQLKAKWTYGEDLADHIMLGGYTAIADTILNTVRYENISSSNLWLDVSYKKSKVTYGLFFGRTNNLGMSTTVNDVELVEFFARGSSIKNINRISPRIQIQWEKLRLAYEFEMTSCDYFSDYKSNLIPSGTKNPVINYRNLFAVYLFF